MYSSTPVQPLLTEAGLVPAQVLLNNRQRMYTYRLLSLPEDHPVKNILPISFRKGDGDTQPGDQPEDTLLWAEEGKANTYGQWLARQIFLTKCVDPTYGVEPVERIWRLNQIPGQVVIRPAKRAIQDANNSQTGLVLWVFLCKESSLTYLNA